jgi:beta-N-acetylhexosaminidase
MINRLNSLPLEQKIGQLFFIGIPGPEIDQVAQDLIDEVTPGGFCLFARNLKDTGQVKSLTGMLDHLSPVTPFLSIDQEGGLVDRLRRIMTPMPAPSKMRNAEDAARLGAIIGETLSIFGFNMDFAPVVDVIDEERSHYQNGLLSRTFGNCREDVIAFGGAFLTNLEERGITGCLKHFPGLGASRVDSHDELPLIDIDEKRHNFIDLFPYWHLEDFTGKDYHAVMVAHAAFPKHALQETDQNGKLLPSSLSYYFVTTLLRGHIGFNGLVITDDLEMGAVVKNYGIGDACKMAINAGVDMLAICASPDAIRAGYHAVLNAAKSGELSAQRIDETLARIAAVKKNIQSPPDYNRDRLVELSNEIIAFNDELGR